MKTFIRILFCAAVILPFSGNLSAQGTAPLPDLQRLLDSAQAVEAPVFAPKTYADADAKMTELKRALELQKKQQSIDNLVADFRSLAENAIKAAGVTKLSLSEYLEPRNKARAARAVTLVPELYLQAEMQFTKACEKVESGDVKGGLKEAPKAGPLFDTAELEAIRKDILGPADKLIETAVVDEAVKHAPTTLNKARTARTKANDVLTKDRYERKESLALAARAEYEARHASNIAVAVRSLERNDQAWEKLMLGYEIEMQKAASEVGLDLLRFDQGSGVAADSLVARIRSMKGKTTSLEEESAAKGRQSAERDQLLMDQLGSTMTRFGSQAGSRDPLVLAQGIDAEVAKLLSEKARVDSIMAATQTEAATLAKVQAETAAELAVRQDKEARLVNAKSLISPSEGEVFVNASNDIVLRLPGLSFDVSKSDIKDEHVPLLKNVEAILKMYPESRLVVEGHTDNKGEPANNTRLSERRAFAVMQYLRQALSIPAERIQSAGYGSDKPVGSNDTPEGRAKNRRIDIIIMQ